MFRGVKQRGHFDCGIATGAMVFGMAYRDARGEFRELFPDSGCPMNDGMTTGEMRAWMETTGFNVRVSRPKTVLGTVNERKIYPGRCAVLTWQGPGYNGHWLMLMNGVAVDPGHHAEPQLPQLTLRRDHNVRAVLWFA